MMRFFVIIAVLLISSASVYGNKHGKKKDRIIGGNDIPIEQYPYMVALQYNGSFYCGGAIIAVNRILTSGACVHGVDKSLLSVRAGSSTFNSGGELIKVQDIRIHPKFKLQNYDYDAAVLVLAKSVKTGPGQKVAKIQPSQVEVENGSDAIISGWGYTTTKPSVPPPVSQELKGATVFIVAPENCIQAYKNSNGMVNSRMICAAADGKDACKGDGGGPMVDLDAVVIGITSWGIDCADPKYPGVYTKVAHPEINKFIVDNLK